MSASEAERFDNDLKTNPDLLEDLKKSAGGLGVSGLVGFAKSKGYSIDVDDVRAYIETKKQDMSEEQLNRIAGGSGGGTVADVVVAVNVTGAVNAAEVASVAGAVAAAIVAAVVVVT